MPVQKVNKYMVRYQSTATEALNILLVFLRDYVAVERFCVCVRVCLCVCLLACLSLHVCMFACLFFIFLFVFRLFVCLFARLLV